MWYIASMIRGMTVDEALRQLSFVLKKGAIPVRDAILEAQKMAVAEQNVEFKTNLWIGKFLTVNDMLMRLKPIFGFNSRIVLYEGESVQGCQTACSSSRRQSRILPLPLLCPPRRGNSAGRLLRTTNDTGETAGRLDGGNA